MSLGSKIAEKRNNVQRRTIEISEWGDDAPLSIYVSPVTGGDIDKLQRKHKDFLNNMTIAGMVDLIIAKAEDADGNRLFTLEDKYTLLAEPVDLIAIIATQIFTDAKRDDPFRLNVMALADRLHKTQDEIEQLSLSEINEWFAYFKVIDNGKE